VTTGIVIFAHGSRIEAANEAVRTIAEKFARAGGHSNVQAAFLELGQPDLSGAVDRLAAAGVRKVLIIPYFLTLGIHLERDLPALIAEIGRRYPWLQVTASAPLDGHPALIEVLLDRARCAET
jgi:sirohydrochlorin ferrochelatase